MNNLREMIGNAIQRAGKKQADITETGVVSSAQAANRKMKTSVWSVDELVAVANCFRMESNGRSKPALKRSCGDEVERSRNEKICWRYSNY